MAMAAVQAIADRNAAKALPIIQAIKKSGATSLHQIADALDRAVSVRPVVVDGTQSRSPIYWPEHGVPPWVDRWRT